MRGKSYVWKRCSLCGGKLNGRGICTEWGLDNSKSDKNYRINRSDCDGMPLHVHEEKEKHRPDRKADPQGNKSQRDKS